MGSDPLSRAIVIERKSVGLAFLLAVVFGPLGMLYTTVAGAIVMLIVTAVVGALTAGVGLLVTWPACVLWACVSAARSQRRMVVAM
ncbi:MAG: hypothetical protein KF787_10490 [Phycisphaeraceae bacterium]|nr:hypothetical protein [Phycisphaerae bacterium]MBX3393063.1 hypothetical protein [Phycisphaeraceae bacterium]